MRGAVDVAREQDRARAGAEERAAIFRELLERVEEAFLAHYFQVRRALAAGEDYAAEACEIAGDADVRVRDAEALENFGVRLVVALDRYDSDFWFARHFMCKSQLNTENTENGHRVHRETRELTAPFASGSGQGDAEDAENSCLLATRH